VKYLFKCLCNLFHSSSVIKKHCVQKKHLKRSSKIHCHFCSKSFGHRHSRYQHIRQKHADLLIQCHHNGCGWRFSAAEDLERHVRYRHVRSESSATKKPFPDGEYLVTDCRSVVIFIFYHKGTIISKYHDHSHLNCT